jgi:hypothetical protein
VRIEDAWIDLGAATLTIPWVCKEGRKNPRDKVLDLLAEEVA